MNQTHVAEATRVVAAATSFTQRIATATDSSKPWRHRVGNTALALQLAARFWPVSRRVFNRHPVSTSIIVLALAYAAYASRPAPRP